MSDRAWWWHDGALSTSTGALSLALTCSAVRLAWAALPVLATLLPCSLASCSLAWLLDWLLGCLLGYLFVCLLALYPTWLVCFLFAWLLASLFHHSCVKQLSNRQSSGEKLCSKTNTGGGLVICLLFMHRIVYLGYFTTYLDSSWAQRRKLIRKGLNIRDF